MNFPRRLTQTERNLIISLLPENRIGYKLFRNKIDLCKVIGFGRLGRNNLILSSKISEPDLTAPSAPIFAVGNAVVDAGEVYIVIHEEFEDQIEIDFSLSGIDELSDEVEVKQFWTYSNWKPGKLNPADNTKVREVHLIYNSLVIAISTQNKKVWIYDDKTGLNHFIPVTKLYDEMMRIKKVKNPEIALDAKRFFSKNADFNDELIGQSFLVYNKYWKKLEIDDSLFLKKTETKLKKSLLKKIFS
ncbi:hypothetical protein BMS3Abin04_03006 [bacterium BMS3Abin04]|nr:hypothetical protein BMS3Abin04_03006 [bacterium BMS3Abin04]